MRKILWSIIAVLLVCAPASADRLFRGAGVPAGGGGGGDSEVTAYFNCDQNTADQPLQKGTGNTVYTGDFSVVSGAVSNALSDNRGWYQFQIPTGSGNLSDSVGTIGFYWRASTITSGAELMESETTPGSAPYFGIINNSSTDLTWNFASTGQSMTVATDTTYFIEVSWNTSTTKMSYRLNGGSWIEVTYTGTPPTLTSSVNWGNATSLANNQWFDQILFSSVYQKDLYAQRANTSF